jgi:hypothetical protein
VHALRSSVLGLLLVLGTAAPAIAQYIYIDTNGNMTHDAADGVSSTGTTHADVWLNTATNRDGSPAACADSSLNSYEFILTAVGGTVAWGTYVSAIGGSEVPVLGGSNPTEYHIVFVSVGRFPPGLYKLGSLDLSIASGSPCLQFAESSTMSPCDGTSFGSKCPGSRFDNTIRLGSDWFDSDATCRSTPGALAGSVLASCPAAGTGVLGVTVDVYRFGTGDLVGSAVTDNTGHYAMASLPPGDYTVTLLTPLGYTASTEEIQVSILSGQSSTANFSLTCREITSAPKTIGYWKHQVAVALGGNGQYQVDAATLCHDLDLIEAHFNSNSLNQVIIYQPLSGATCVEKIEVAKDILNLTGSAAMIDRARQQLMALLLNVAAGYISQNEIISADGATVTQAITYCDNLIDAAGSNVEKAKTIADMINNGQKVPAGMVPLGTMSISYSLERNRIQARVSQNPGNQEWTFRFVTQAQGRATLRVYDLAGRHVATVLDGVIPAGAHSIAWAGRGRTGTPLANGLYLARLVTASGTARLKLLQMHP